MRRLLLVGALVIGAQGGFFAGVAVTHRPNGSSDGRYHSCGYVTEQGVTEHLAAYAERCGR